MIFNCYVSQQQYSWDCDVWHNRHLDLKIRVLTARASLLRSNARETLLCLKKNDKTVSHNMKATGKTTRIA
jgi:hypothetical protein